MSKTKPPALDLFAPENKRTTEYRPVHTCHWPGCGRAVPPKMWGCQEHWFQLPKALRDKIWATYKPGQEITKDPSLEYIKAAKLVQAWILKNSVKGNEPC